MGGWKEWFSEPDSYERYVVLMDIKMPEVGGVEACQRIKKMDTAIPVAELRAYAQASERKRIMSKSFDGFLAKPFAPVELLKVLSELGQPHL